MSTTYMNHYLALVTILSVGVLSGCGYCIPLLVISLLFPVVNYVTTWISSSFQKIHLGGIKS
jgi:hypothetical protein